MSARLPLLTAGLVVAAQMGLAQEGGCPAAPEPVLGLSFDSRYQGSDEARATVNPETEAEAEAALKPLDDFIRDLSVKLGSMLEQPAEDRREAANCLIGQIAQWARADALSDQGSETTQLTIGARLASFAIIAGKAMPHTTDYAGLDDIRGWLTRRMNEQMLFWEVAPPGAASGNLRAWAGLAGAATADLTGDVVLRGWSTWSTAYVLCLANPDGSLPQEMTRGKYALHYQLHALSPLVTSVLMLERQGVSLMDRCDGALDRAVAFALSDLDSGDRTRQITGQTQSFFDGTARLEDFQLAWLEAYLVLNSDPAIENLASKRRPLSFSKLGGNQTLLWKP
ncbi:alginate lyase family protein [Tropicibacter oceani]|uniref:Alginate lyase family protein n=1 Tax=Tropicibacter oceani TaxID=3058420 RepID=A0ABY8QIB9_9RHOB|nr:alginate lyase family protein [Tropicibacter oceani]WGW04284.1 alginate lyase family protein [Tropicibacter oceani]